jgi:FMN-dependent NADH-azoreductase
MKALVLNGASTSSSLTESVGEMLIGELKELGWDVETIILRKENIGYCRGCFGCWVKTPGVCLIDDSADALLNSWMKADLLVLLTPITFGGYSSELKKAVDRMIPTVSPFFMKVQGEIHHRPRYKRNPRLLAVGVLLHPYEDKEQIFTRLVDRNAINWHNPTHSVLVVTSDDLEPDIRQRIRNIMTRLGNRR